MGTEVVAVQHLLDEALAAAVDRAVDPALLQGASLEQLLPPTGGGN